MKQKRRKSDGMYCVNCGEKVNVESKFCHACGTEIQAQYSIQEEKTIDKLDHQNEMLETEQSEPADEEHFANFVGKNKGYYQRKWAGVNDPSSSVSWNWAAFFLGPFWLGYRKMYRHIFIWFGLFLLLDLFDVLIGNTYEVSSINYIVSFVLYLLVGMFGNALYYRHAKKQVEKNKFTYADGSELKYVGGTSSKGVFVAVGGLIAYFISFLLIFNAFGTNVIVFGTSEGMFGVNGIQDSFHQDQAIYYEVDFGETIGRSTVEIVVLRDYGNYEEVLAQYEEYVDPTWNGFYNEFYDPLYYPTIDRGNYIVRAYRGGELLSEGSFSIR